MMTTLGVDGHWLGVHDGDARALALFKQHYSYRRRAHGQPRGSPTFVGQGEKMVLLTLDCKSLFVWQYSTVERKDGQPGVRCSVFRNTSDILSSVLIQEADQLAFERWPKERHYTYVDSRKIQSGLPGMCFLAAHWHYMRCSGHRLRSKTGLFILEKTPP
jgi:hypothetical protein